MDFEARLIAALEADIAANRLILPTLPDVALEVQRITQRIDASLPELAAAISRDPGLSARLLKVANSAMMRSSRPIEDIRGAIQRLGLRLVRSLVSSLAIIQTYQHGSTRMQDRLREISSHSSEIAAIGYALAAQYTRINPDEALLAGLIHDIGKLPLLRRGAEMPEVANRLEALQGPCDKLHTKVGAMVLQSWSFPASLVEVAREHENMNRSGGKDADLVDVVIVANLIAHRDATPNPYASLKWSEVPAVQRLGLADNPDPVSQELYQTAREILGV